MYSYLEQPQPRLPAIHDMLQGRPDSSRFLESSISSSSLAQHSTVTAHSRAQRQQYSPPNNDYVLGPSTAHDRAQPQPCPPHNNDHILRPSRVRKARTPNKTNDHVLEPLTAHGRAQHQQYSPPNNDHVLGPSKVRKARTSNKPKNYHVLGPPRVLKARPFNKPTKDHVLGPLGVPDAHTFNSPNFRNQTGAEKSANRDEKLVIRIANLQNVLLRSIPQLDERAIPRNRRPYGGWRSLTANNISQNIFKTSHPNDVLRFNKVGILESSTEIHEQSEVLFRKVIQRLKALGDTKFAQDFARDVVNRGCM